jgi:hypothetical protein
MLSGRRIPLFEVLNSPKIDSLWQNFEIISTLGPTLWNTENANELEV